MSEKIDSFLELSKLFLANGYHLFLVGGSVRDFLVYHELFDMDVVTDATPEQMLCFIPEADKTFMKYGFLKCQLNNIKFDITTLRKEKGYKDARHPTKIKFVTSLKKDYKRRDFTINGMYLDDHFKLIDYCNGKKDIENKVIRTIGNASRRIKEDPLRILRAIRFASKLNYHLDPSLTKAIKKYGYLLNKLNKEKIKQELNKFPQMDVDFKNKIFNDFAIKQYLDVLE